MRFSCLRRRNESLATECLAAIASASYTLSRPCADDTVSISAVYVHSEKEQKKKKEKETGGLSSFGSSNWVEAVSQGLENVRIERNGWV